VPKQCCKRHLVPAILLKSLSTLRGRLSCWQAWRQRTSSQPRRAAQRLSKQPARRPRRYAIASTMPTLCFCWPANVAEHACKHGQLHVYKVLNPSDRLCTRLAALRDCRPASQRASQPSQTPTLPLLSQTSGLRQHQTTQGHTQLPSLQLAEQMAAQRSRSHSIQTTGVAER
jgi:hypothetical protein